MKMTKNKGFHVIIDNVGKATLSTSMKLAAPGGKIVMVGNTSGPLAEIDIRYIFSKQISIIGSTMGSREDFRTISALLQDGKIRPVIDSVMPLREGKEAYRRMEEGGQLGKSFRHYRRQIVRPQIFRPEDIHIFPHP